jgi:hypothetical protein
LEIGFFKSNALIIPPGLKSDGLGMQFLNSRKSSLNFVIGIEYFELFSTKQTKVLFHSEKN